MEPTRMTVYAPPGASYALVRGRLKPWLIRHSIPAMHSATARGWWVRTERLPDVLALADLDHVAVKTYDALPYEVG